MSYTAQKIHDRAIALIDEVSESGTIDANKTKEYSSRAPYLLDMGQKELADNGMLTSILEYPNTVKTTYGKWTKETLPTMKRIVDVMFIDSDSQIYPIDYKTFGKTDIYFYYSAIGEARLLYVPVPVEITSLSQTIEIDDISAMALAYYLAEHYALADQNDELAKVCRNKFQQLKVDSSVKDQMASGYIIDEYGVKGGV